MEILGGIHLVDNMLMMGSGGPSPLNVGLLIDKGAITLVDAGPPGSHKVISSYIEKIGYPLSAVKRIIITHYHADHMGGLADLAEATGAEVWAHREDADYIDGSKPFPPINFPEALLKSIAPAATPEEYAAIRQQLQKSMEPKRAAVDLRLAGGETLDVLGGCQLLHTPGHTPGHLCLYLPERSLLIAGDLIRCGQDCVSGPVPHFTLNMEEAHASLKELLNLPFDHAYGYHGVFLSKDAREKIRQSIIKE